jgi:hypothetical protein
MYELRDKASFVSIPVRGKGIKTYNVKVNGWRIPVFVSIPVRGKGIKTRRVDRRNNRNCRVSIPVRGKGIKTLVPFYPITCC